MSVESVKITVYMFYGMGNTFGFCYPDSVAGVRSKGDALHRWLVPATEW